MGAKKYWWLSLIMLTGCGLTETKKEYYYDGQLKSEAEMVDDKKSGVLTTYYPSGNVKSKELFRDDTLNGVSIFFDDSGRIDSVVNFEKGFRDGKFLKFYSNGYVSESGEYNNNRLSGLYYRYYPYDSGKVLYEAYLLNVDGEEMQYYVKKFDLKGNILEESKSIDIKILPEPIRLGDIVSVEFELVEKGTYDSAIIVVGNFDNTFKPLTPPDTLLVNDGKAHYELTPQEKGIQSIKGEYIIYKNEVFADSSVNYSSYGYFEEKISVN